MSDIGYYVSDIWCKVQISQTNKTIGFMTNYPGEYKDIMLFVCLYSNIKHFFLCCKSENLQSCAPIASQ